MVLSPHGSQIIANASTRMPRYVILRHESSTNQPNNLHWDFMIQCGPVLQTWALSEQPTLRQEIIATAIADHRLAYLEYEGPISGDRGRVSRWDAGTYEIVAASPDELSLRLTGGRLLATVQLRRTPDDNHRWIFVFSA